MPFAFMQESKFLEDMMLISNDSIFIFVPNIP